MSNRQERLEELKKLKEAYHNTILEEGEEIFFDICKSFFDQFPGVKEITWHQTFVALDDENLEFEIDSPNVLLDKDSIKKYCIEEDIQYYLEKEDDTYFDAFDLRDGTDLGKALVALHKELNLMDDALMLLFGKNSQVTVNMEGLKSYDKSLN